jgi:RNA polymerase subunit RPABC4/transcription elongation factor Spt4
MNLPSLDTIITYTTMCVAVFSALLAALWLSLVIWTFRDMRSRSRDPFAQLLAALVVAALPIIGLIVYLILRPPETLADSYERALEEEALLQEIEDRPACPGCSRTVDRHWLLCPHCHTRLRKACPDCQALMELRWTLCPYCGNRQIDPYHVQPPLSEGAESRHVTGGQARGSAEPRADRPAPAADEQAAPLPQGEWAAPLAYEAPVGALANATADDEDRWPEWPEVEPLDEGLISEAQEPDEPAADEAEEGVEPAEDEQLA